jgi:hypothetical protein
MTIKINKIESIPLAKLRTNGENPKKAFTARGLKGLRVSLQTFGFAGACVVAPDPDGMYTILDANTRYDELRASGISEIPCVIMDQLNTPEERKKFVLAFDRHKKLFDEEMVMKQLQELTAKNENADLLRELAGYPGQVNDLFGDKETGVSNAAEKELNPGKMSSLMLSGPEEDIEHIRHLIRVSKAKLGASKIVLSVLGHAVTILDWEEERLLAVLLSTAIRFGAEA